MRVAIYCRVSSEEQTQGFSLEAQAKACREFAKARGWEVATMFVDPGYSARTDKRPEFKRMIEEAQAGKFDAIIVHKFDRFARNRKDAVTYKALLKQAGLNVYSVSEPIDPDDPSSLITEGMLEVMAEWFSANLSRETSKGKRARAEAGYQNNAAPFGYHKDRGREAIAQIDPQTVEGYRLAMNKALEGLTDLKVAWALNQAGYRATTGRLFSKDTVGDMLRSRFYIGEVCYKGQWHPGRHAPAIDRETWERVQAIRGGRIYRPDKATMKARPYPLTPVLYCAECRHGMRGNSIRGNRYYRDTGKEHGLPCSQGEVRAEVLEEQVGAFIAALHLPDDWRAQALERLGQDAAEVRRIERDRRKLEGELYRTKKLYIAGDLSEGEYNHEKARISTSSSNLVVPTLPDLSAAAMLLADFGTVWKQANGPERKRLVCALLAHVWVRGKNVVSIEPKADVYYLLAAQAAAISSGPPPTSILLIPPGASLQALFSKARHVAHEEITK